MPQRSVLSVTLFSLAINEILIVYHEICKSFYVDNLVIYYAAVNVNHIERKLQIAINNINTWAMNNGYNISNNKTKAVHFHRKYGLQHEPTLILNDKNIYFKK